MPAHPVKHDPVGIDMSPVRHARHVIRGRGVTVVVARTCIASLPLSDWVLCFALVNTTHQTRYGASIAAHHGLEFIIELKCDITE